MKIRKLNIVVFVGVLSVCSTAFGAEKEESQKQNSDTSQKAESNFFERVLVDRFKNP